MTGEQFSNLLFAVYHLGMEAGQGLPYTGRSRQERLDALREKGLRLLREAGPAALGSPPPEGEEVSRDG